MTTVRAPADQRVLGEVPDDTPASVDGKVAAARAALRRWWALNPRTRAEALLAIADDTAGQVEDLARLLSLEQGKTVREARLELDRYVGPFRQYAGLATAGSGGNQTLGVGVSGFVDRRPVGVVAGVVPWNFPASLFASKLAPALAAGCAFLIKPAETTPLITLRLTQIAQGHLPEGLLAVVTGGPEVATGLIRHPDVARIAFTGSTAVGRRIGAEAGRGLKRLSLELGGCDPFVLCEDADLRRAVRALMGTRFYNAGQVCVAPKRLIVAQEVRDEVVDLLTERLGRVVPGPGTDATSTMGSLHTERGRDLLEEQIADAVEHGAQLVGGGRPDGPALAKGWFTRPALLVDPAPEARVRIEETFGPVLTVVTTRSDDEAVVIANETPYGLGCSVWSADQPRAFRAAARIEAGYVWVNTLARVYDELPFGGVKDSGLGREHGIEAFDSYRESRSIIFADPALGD